MEMVGNRVVRVRQRRVVVELIFIYMKDKLDLHDDLMRLCSITMVMAIDSHH